ncbi:MAG: B-box zinc finger protein [Thermoanaerobaculia bacterium]|nr:B-box zinc finger protein [Thermoanaerobaculia bacterium]
MPTSCAAHPERAAAYRCEACHRALCEACVETSHRLWFCRHCRERALPLALDAPPAPHLRVDRVRAAAAPLSLARLLWPGRRGAATILGWAAVLAVGASLIPPFSWFAPAAAALLLPGYLLEAVRAARDGEADLPPWPDLTDAARWGSDWSLGVVALLVATLPYLLLRRLAGCDVESFLIADGSLCLAAAAGGAGLGLTVLAGALGAAALWGSGWLAVRLDLHLEAIGATGGGTLVAGLVCGLPAGVVAALAATPGGGPPGAGLARNVLGLWALFATARAAGWLFGRHAARLEAVYGTTADD